MIDDALIPALVVGGFLYALIRVVIGGFYTVAQNERAVKTICGRAERVGNDATTLALPIAASLRPDERERYVYPQIVVIPPGGPYFKWPWERVFKVNIATETVSLAYDPETPDANGGGTRLEAVTKDHLNTAISGQIRFRVSELNLYAYLFGIKRPFAHVMGYFVSVLRQRVAGFEAPRIHEGAVPALVPASPALPAATPAVSTSLVSTVSAAQTLATASLDTYGAQGISINDLRKNLRDLNDHMEADCVSSAARYGVVLSACLITRIDPPDEVESALAAINTAYNHVSSETSLAQASADQRIVQSRRAVEIETLRAQAEVEPLRAVARELALLDDAGPGTLGAYVRNLRLALLSRARRAFLPHDIGGTAERKERL